LCEAQASISVLSTEKYSLDSSASTSGWFRSFAASRSGVLVPPRYGMHITLTPSCLLDVIFFSLKKPRSDPYNLGILPKSACGVPARSPRAVSRLDSRPIRHTA
jgi:hypothetical protein